MLDQSFSLNNFIKIFEIENRKGNFERSFYSDEFHRLSSELKRKRLEIKTYKRHKNVTPEDTHLIELYDQKKEIESLKEKELENTLQDISENVNKKQFKFEFSSFYHEESGKTVFPVRNTAESYFAMKQLQFNVSRTFKVKQENRYLVSKQLQCLLRDSLPKIILRTDIKSFYESVPQYKLLNVINDNQLLSPKSKQLIRRLFHDYNIRTDQDALANEEKRGLPRGAGISAYMAELYMREIDSRIQRIDDVMFFGRYVDDIIVLFKPQWNLQEKDYMSKIESVIKASGLQLNDEKTDVFNTSKDNQTFSITYLGYQFNFKNSNYSGTSLSPKKKLKYLERLKSTLENYLEQKIYTPKSARKLLVHRFNYLTKNTKLHRPKKGYVGIFYNNSLIDLDCNDLDELDQELCKIVDTKIPSTTNSKLNAYLKQFSFKDGFQKKLFFNVNSKRKRIDDLRSAAFKEKKKLDNNFERIISVWK